jgi:catechol 2,3-dioxygenase-like lactoylglutathione lyase family enzyme
MKRIHIGLEVANLEESLSFYTTLFGQPPTLREADYAKWQIDDPHVNFSITARGGEAPGGVHFGVQVESPEDLGALSARLERAGENLIPTGCTECCYHKSEKVWVIDPDANRWETFHTSGRHTTYGQDQPQLKTAHEKKLAEMERGS